MVISDEDILRTLISEKIVDEKNEIIDEDKFKSLLLAVFLSQVSHERIKSFWKKHLSEERLLRPKDRYEKISSFYKLTFHFTGFGNKTVFISDKNINDRVFNEEFIQSIVNSKEDIHFYRRMAKLTEITDEVIRASHQCTAEFCKDCRDNFTNILFGKLDLFLKALDVRSYVILNIPILAITNFVDPDSLIEEWGENNCDGCQRPLLEHFKFCPECGTPVSKTNNNEYNNREKVLNQLLGWYIRLKNKLSGHNSNAFLHQSTRETDVYLKNGNKSLLIEGTTQVNLQKDYIIDKAFTLLLIDSLDSNIKNYLVLWALDKNCSSERNESYVKDIFREKRFFFNKYSQQKQILKGGNISINNEELQILKDEFYSVLDNLNQYTRDLLLS